MPIFDWIKSHVGQSVMIALLLPIFGWAWSTNTRTIEHGVLLQTNERRIDAIASVLPEMRVRVANEVINRPNAATILTLKNYTPNQNASVFVVGMLGEQNDNMRLFSFHGKPRGTAETILIGSIASADKDYFSFKELEELSLSVKRPIFSPSDRINPYTSFTLQVDSSTIGGLLSKNGFEEECEIEIGQSQASSWAELMSVLNVDSHAPFGPSFDEKLKACLGDDR